MIAFFVRDRADLFARELAQSDSALAKLASQTANLPNCIGKGWDCDLSWAFPGGDVNDGVGPQRTFERLYFARAEGWFRLAKAAVRRFLSNSWEADSVRLTAGYPAAGHNLLAYASAPISWICVALALGALRLRKPSADRDALFFAQALTISALCYDFFLGVGSAYEVARNEMSAVFWIWIAALIGIGCARQAASEKPSSRPSANNNSISTDSV